MTNQNPFFPGQEEPAGQHRGLMEELNIPPQIIQFIRQNAKHIQIGLVTIVVAVVVVLGINSYHDSVRQKTNELLVQAMKVKDVETKNVQLQELYDDYPGSDAAIWSQFELAHNAKKSGNADEALERYQLVADKIGKNSPLVPMILLAKGQVLESSVKLDEAIALYTQLADYAGYSYVGKSGIARIYELQNNKPAALAVYNELKDDTTLPPQIRERLSVKNALLMGANKTVTDEVEGK